MEQAVLPQGYKPIVKWVYKEKKNAKGKVERYKARLVEKGYSQREGIDYEEVFSLVSRLETVRLIISLATQNRWKINQMDVKSAFLNGFLKEEVYIEQPLGYEVKGHEEKVLKCPYEHALYIKIKNEDILIVCLYVDDLIFTGSNSSMFEELKKDMAKEFEMTNIGLMSYYLDIEVKQEDKGIFITQEDYAKEVLKKFNMDDSNLVSTPLEYGTKLSKHDERGKVDPTLFKSLVESLHYLTCTRPNILYAVS
uniref:Reverse transcriptase Ty1/copia-type domain-containing protein n=1 Tax=Cannabis sativa TaxID=3483 RepID=A0A803PC26_CANSA